MSSFGLYGGIAGALTGAALTAFEGSLSPSISRIITNSFISSAIATYSTHSTTYSSSNHYHKDIFTAIDRYTPIDKPLFYVPVKALAIGGSIIGATMLESGFFYKYPQALNYAAYGAFGAYTSGKYGVVAAVAAYGFDQLNEKYNFTLEYNFSFSAIIVASSLVNNACKYYSKTYRADFNLKTEAVHFLASTLISLPLKAYTSIADLNLDGPISLYNNVYNITATITGKEEADSFFSNQMILYPSIELFRIIFLQKARGDFNLYRLHGANIIASSATESSSHIAFKSSLLSFSKNLALFLSSYVFSNLVSQYYTNQLFTTIYDKQMDDYLDGHNALKLANNERLIDGLATSVYQFASNSVNLNQGIISIYEHSIYGFVFSISNRATDTVVTVFGFNGFVDAVTKFISEKMAGSTAKIRNDKNEYIKYLKHLHSNAKIIVEGKGGDFVKEQLYEAQQSLRINQVESEFLATLQSLWMQVLNWASSVISFASIIKLVDMPIGNIGTIAVLASNADSANKILSWGSSHAMQIQLLQNSAFEINKLSFMLNSIQPNLADSIVTSHGNSETTLNLDLRIAGQGEVMLSAHNITIYSSKIYALTGASGSGKSSLISKVMGIEYNGIQANGTISYSVDDLEQISLITQKNFIPKNSSLFEVIMYPRTKKETNSLADEYRPLASKILQQLGEMSPRDLETELASIKDWSSELSGGQLKLLFITRALLSGSKIIFLDEVFAGLDKNLIKVTQRLLEEFVKQNNATLIIVDHNAKDNNYNGFYDREIYIEDGILRARDIEGATFEAEEIYHSTEEGAGVCAYERDYSDIIKLSGETCLS